MMMQAMHDSIYLNGRLTSLASARLSPMDHGFTVGDGVFESLITYGCTAFALRRHYQRLCHSASLMGLPMPDYETLRHAVHAVITANGCTHARLRITLTRGEAPLGSELGQEHAPTFVVASANLPKRPELARVHLVKWTRNEHGALNQIKSTSYGENVIALAAAQAQGAQEAVFCNTQGHLCEGSGSNLFLVQNGVLHTPPLAEGCLAGITRAIVMEIATAAGLPLQENPLPREALWKAEEACLTSTFREVQSITQADEHAIPAGPVTARLQALFRLRTQAGNLEEA